MVVVRACAGGPASICSCLGLGRFHLEPYRSPSTAPPPIHRPAGTSSVRAGKHHMYPHHRTMQYHCGVGNRMRHLTRFDKGLSHHLMRPTVTVRRAKALICPPWMHDLDARAASSVVPGGSRKPSPMARHVHLPSLNHQLLHSISTSEDILRITRGGNL